MREEEKILVRKRIGPLKEALRKRRFDPHFFETPQEAQHFILDRIKPEEKIGIGGSVTLRDHLQIVEELRKRGHILYDHWEANHDPRRRLELKRSQRGADVFLSGMNAIAMDGTIVNLDGGGNRVAGLCSGPKRVIAVAGANKMVETMQDAIHRTRQRAAVLRVLKGPFKTPCEATGKCSDCDSPQRICAALLILFKKPEDIDEFTVILINEEMGY